MYKLEIDWIEGNCPVQSEGLIDGMRYYFRARWSHWSLTVETEQEEWFYREKYGTGPYDAGWMAHDEARKMIEKGAALFHGFMVR